MNKKNTVILSVIVVLSLLLVSCSGGGADTSLGADTQDFSGGTTQLGTDIEGEPLVSEAGAVDASQIEFKGKDIYSDYNGATAISLSDSAASEGPNYTVEAGRVSIRGEGTYVLSGKLTDGQIVVDAPKDADVRLVLSGVDIYCSYSSPIFVNSADKVIVSLPEGSVNRLEDKAVSTTADGIEITAALYSRESLSINGNGTLEIKAANDAITSKDTLKITGGKLTLNAQDDGIVGKDRVLISDGDITVKSVGDAVKSTNSEDKTLGYVYIGGGSFDITCDGDGIVAETSMLITGGRFVIKTGGGASSVSNTGRLEGGGFFGKVSASESSQKNASSLKALNTEGYLDISGGSFDIDCADDALHSADTVRINNGVLSIATGDDGVHADKKLEISGGAIEITRSYEGLESQDIGISGGYINITASDDGINAAGGSDGQSEGQRPWQDRFNTSQSVSFVISGGEIYVNAQGDGVDSNGSITMTGGMLFVSGPTNSGNGYIDVGENGHAFYMNGGIYIGAGTSGMMVTPSSESKQNSITANVSGKAGSTLSFKSADGTELASFTVAKQYSTVTVSTPDIKIGDKVSVYVDGTISCELECSSVSTGSNLAGGMGGPGSAPGQKPGRPSGIMPR